MTSDVSDWRKGEWKQEGIFLTPDKKYAKTFAGKTGKITNAFADVKNTFKIKNKGIGEIYNIDTINDALIEGPENHKTFINMLKKKGYDSLESYDGKQLLVFNPDQIKTKSQLTDIWNKANKKTAK
jgi:UDP-2,3-diacylglucosamine pyrophosphatase LpxH